MKLSIKSLFLSGLFLTLLACESDLTTLDISASDSEPKIVVTGYVFADGAALSITSSVPAGLQDFDRNQFHLSANSTSAELIDDSGNVYALTYIPRRKEFVYQGTLPLNAIYSLQVNSDGLPPTVSNNLRFTGGDSARNRITCTFDTSEVRTDFSFANVKILINNPEDTYYGAVSLVEDPPENNFVRNHFIVLPQDELVSSQCGWFVNDGIFIAANTCFAETIPIVDYNIKLGNFYLDTTYHRSTEIFNFPERVGTLFGVISEADYRYVRSIRRNENLIEEYLLTPSLQNFSNIEGGYGYVMMINGTSCWIDLE